MIDSLFHLRIGSWHQIGHEIVPDIWAPDIRFLNLINMDPIMLAGKNVKHYEFWLQKTKAGSQMQIYQSFKVEFACGFHFYEYPFDSHSCVLNYDWYANVQQQNNFDEFNQSFDE